MAMTRAQQGNLVAAQAVRDNPVPSEGRSWWPAGMAAQDGSAAE